GSNMAAYSVNTFTVPLFQRWFAVSLTPAATLTGVVVGLTGLVALTAGAWVADRAGRRSPTARVMVGTASMLVAAPLAWWALSLGRDAVGAFVAIFGVAWPLQYGEGGRRAGEGGRRDRPALRARLGRAYHPPAGRARPVRGCPDDQAGCGPDAPAVGGGRARPVSADITTPNQVVTAACSSSSSVAP